MKILCIADEENKGLWDHFNKEKLEGIDLILSAGDLNPDYLQFLVTMGKAPVLYVHGNHDESYSFKPPLGCECIEDKVYDFKGLRILGLGGAPWYKPGKFMFTEEEMRKRVQKVKKDIFLKNGFDILLTHAPIRGYGDMDDPAHRGFLAFEELVQKYRPKYMVHGHVHANYGSAFKRELVHSAGTKIVNAYDKAILELEEQEYPKEGKTGSFLYDLYKQVTAKKEQRRFHD